MKCPECNYEIKEDAEFCKHCGLVIDDEPIDFNREIEEVEKMLPTKQTKNKKLTNLGILELKLNTAIDSKLKRDFIKLQNILLNIYIPEYILEETLRKYVKLFMDYKINNLKRDVIFAVLIITTTKQHQFNINTRKVLELLKVKHRIYSKYKIELGYNKPIIQDGMELIEQYANIFKLPDIIKQKAIITYNKIPEDKKYNKIVTAVSCIYLAASFYNAGLTQEMVYKQLGISSTCLRNNYKKHIEYLPLTEFDVIE